ncbi:adenosylcobinamide-GDP ribazoletransferase [Novosphingobium sp. JCM 18896]|uniref:adenosylcobinamide-GDP ribazoletransferase n=1 Tax=Novosphingobium sp. JCM 18896 TaxID=2989731 RepID=UPI002223E871|nr:adenosylcobinamide-GDP ribazoletransferase [Novosphingobium sp. JCM 18896]MCW1427483.1 adenosylcobinamide-GDP ribazoletransferase [Novosphingobium sp. JCM 18896]
MKGFVIALQFLTRLPMPRVAVSSDEFAASMRWFPAAGLVVGAIVGLGAVLGARIDPWLGALVGLVLWVAVTGALHLDGLGDAADAAGAAHKDPERLRAVFADPHVGSFAVVAIGLQLVAKLVLIRSLLVTAPPLALALIPFAARIGPLAWTRWLPPLHEGLGARFRDTVRPVDLALWGLVLLAASWFVPGLLAALLFIPLWTVWLRARFGGVSGDLHGAGIEIVESGLLLAAIVGARLI